MRRALVALFAVAAFSLSTGHQVSAQVINFFVDETGRGYALSPTFFPGVVFNDPGTMMADPGPGGLASALTYSLLGPPSVVAGDVLLYEPGSGNTLSDVIRFNPAGTGVSSYAASLVFYSDTADAGGEIPSLADTGFPISFYANTVNLRETTPSPNVHTAVYTPLPGQPGYVSGFVTTYNITSSVPEPGPLVLGAAAGLAALGCTWVRRSRRAV